MAAIASPADHAWALDQIRKYARVAPRYAECASVLGQVLKAAARRVAPFAFVETRPKGLPSFAEKIFRKRSEITDPVNQFTDLCGGRVVTTTRCEAKAFCEFVERHFEVDWENSVDVRQRLKPSEFGYLSVHYIVQFRPGDFPTKDIPVKIPSRLFPDRSAPMKAEVQVRTLLEHAWAVFGHDRCYKSAFRIPDKWQRELAAVAAVLESSDQAFDRVQEGLETYAANYGKHLGEAQLREEIAILEHVLRYDRGNTQMAHRLARLALALGDWGKAIAVLSPHARSGSAPILRDLGMALCKKNRAHPRRAPYRRGQRLLENANANAPDVESLCALASSYKGLDEGKARRFYRQAFETDPSDPYPLGCHLEYEIAAQRSLAPASVLGPTLEQAVQRCREQIAVGVNLPWAFFDLGKFLLFLGRPLESLTAYARGLQLSTASFMVETTLASVERLAVVEDKLPGLAWVRHLLILGHAVRFPTPATRRKVRRLATPRAHPLAAPVVIFTGGCDPSVEPQMRSYGPMVKGAFRDFHGTVISGGTTAGISGLVGAMQRAYPRSLRTIGYLPEALPEGTGQDRRYRELRRTPGHRYGPREALQYWCDLTASRIAPFRVKVLGINGGDISAFEYRLALALGAEVAVIEDSGRAAGRLLADEDWGRAPLLYSLPAEAEVVRAFLVPRVPAAEPGPREVMAQAIHEGYRRQQLQESQSREPSLALWEKLGPDLQESNRQQADHIFEKLRRLGCTVHTVAGREAARVTLSRQEVETLAEQEHARRVLERLRAGWRWGPVRDVEKKISPWVVGWSKLPEEVRERDREAVRRIPGLLAKVGLEIRRRR